MKTFSRSVATAIITAGFTAGLAGSAWAKLPAPPQTDEAKAKAAEAAAKTAHTGKVDAFKLCASMDKVAGHWNKTAKSLGKEAKPATATPACADPGPFVWPLPAAAAAPAAPAVAAAPAAPVKK
jgi:hypothetical protein